jgi:hypothetical protein
LKIDDPSKGRRAGPIPVEEPRVFSDHVRRLAQGNPLNAQELDILWNALRAALRSELKRRGLWDCPPSYLGIYGWESWEPSGASGDSAVEELLAECYTYIFVLRLRSLQAQLKIKPNIDGLVFLNIRHFLHERQKEHDPLGSQVFAVLQSAVRMALAGGDLRVLEGDARVRNDTVLSFSRGLAPERTATEGIAALAARWNDDLLPDLVTLRGRQQEEVVRRLLVRLSDLRSEGFQSFRFKDLVDPLKADTRARWAALLERSQGETAAQTGEQQRKERVRLVSPDTRIEERQLFNKLIDCVLTSLARLDVNERTRRYLMTLWQFVRLQASEGDAVAPPAAGLDRALWVDSDAGPGPGDDEPPSLRRIAEQLRIPRERLPDFYATLGRLLEECRATVPAKATAAPPPGRFGVPRRRVRPDDH